MTETGVDETLLAPGEPVDLDNCAREPIHIPGSIQPRGALLVVSDPGGDILQASTNTAELLARPATEVVGQPLGSALGEEAAAAVIAHAHAGGEVRDRNPLPLSVTVGGAPTTVDAIVHRPPGAEQEMLVVELEPVSGTRPLSFANTYQAVRGAVGSLNRARSLPELYEVTAQEVRDLTGFDRVMVYRFDADHNGEVVAEAKRADLNPFLGLHYPATDIPSQARALYEKNWIRLISDVGYTPAPVVPTLNPHTRAPLDLTHATLRSVSPIHIEYLQNMGVTASMSISLLREGRLWGLIACHHYSGPHTPPYGVRASAEFLGSVLSLRLVAQVEEERIAAARRVARDLAGLVGASRDEHTPLAQALTGDRTLLELMDADGAVVRAQGDTVTLGHAPAGPQSAAILTWAADAGEDLACTTSLSRDAPELAALVPEVAGVLAITMAGGDAVAWLRREAVHDVDWGGDPYNKAIARREGDTVRLSPRRSFERWRETVRGSSLPWTDEQAETARLLRRHVVEAMYLRTQRDARAAEALQRGSLPERLPVVPGWSVTARYAPSGGGRVGGDWYDAFLLPDGRLAVTVGDVVGHGMAAAATMGQLRNALRVLLLRGSPGPAVAELDALVRATMPDQMATLLVGLLDPGTGELDYVRAGHLPPLVLHPDAEPSWPAAVRTMPLGYVPGPPEAGHLTVPEGGGVLLFTDGLVERRGVSLAEGLESLRAACGAGSDLDAVVAAVRDPASDDDATAVLLRRDRHGRAGAR